MVSRKVVSGPIIAHEQEEMLDRFLDFVRYRDFDPGRGPGPAADESRSVTAAFRYEVTLATREGVRVLTAQAEREVALMAESVLRRYEGETLAIGFTVVCPEPGARQRIVSYLRDLMLELNGDRNCATLLPGRGLSLFP